MIKNKYLLVFMFFIGSLIASSVDVSGRAEYFYMTRYGNTFVNNISKGGSCIREDIDPSIINLAIESSKLLNIDFCGVDIMQYKNKYYVIEINSIPAWKGLQNIEEEIISEHFVSLLL